MPALFCLGLHEALFFSIKEQNENTNNNSTTTKHTNKQPTTKTTNTHTTHTGAAAGLNQPAETAGQPNMLCDSQFTTDRLERLVPETHTQHTPERTQQPPRNTPPTTTTTTKRQQRQLHNCRARSLERCNMHVGGAARVQCHGFANGLASSTPSWLVQWLLKAS